VEGLIILALRSGLNLYQSECYLLYNGILSATAVIRYYIIIIIIIIIIVGVIKSRRMRWAGHVARMDQGRGVHKVLVGKPERKRPLGRPRSRWKDNIKMDLREVGRGCGDWMELAQDRDRWRALVSTAMNFWVPENAGNFLINCKTS
jgi:hypothetical protein